MEAISAMRIFFAWKGIYNKSAISGDGIEAGVVTMILFLKPISREVTHGIRSERLDDR